MKKKPIHFHMSYDAQGSVLKKNVVVHSNQRAYVIHGTHNVTLEENVAFDVFGTFPKNCNHVKLFMIVY